MWLQALVMAVMLLGACTSDSSKSDSQPPDASVDGSKDGGADAGDGSSDATDGATDGTDGPSTPTYYIAPTGKDTNAGTAQAPWKTFAFAISKLQAGDALVVLDGTYDATVTGYLNVDCSGGAKNGTAAKPITVRAANERAAFLLGNGSGRPILLQNCAYWTLEGLRAEDADYPDETGVEPGTVVVVESSNHITLRRLLVSKPNRHCDAHGILISLSQNVLVEESEVYLFHRHGIQGWKSSALTFRRNYVNSRDYADLFDYASGCPALGDEGMSFNATHDSLAENNIAEDVCQGFTVHGDRAATADTGVADNNRYFGNIGLNAGQTFELDTRCGSQTPCPGDRDVSHTRYHQNVAIGGDVGFYLRAGNDNEVDQGTVMKAGQGVVFDLNGGENAGFSSNARVIDSLVVGPASYGFHATGQANWTFDHCNAWQTSIPYEPNLPADPHVISSIQVDPVLGGCMVALPNGSPMKKAGKAGADIGASVVFRYQDATLTTTRLWDAQTGAFPCGATAAGLNDTAPNSCSGVQQRLNVGSGGCTMP